MSLDVLDEIATLAAAASKAPDRATRAVYVAEARIRLAAAQERIARSEVVVAAQEAELARLFAAGGSQ